MTITEKGHHFIDETQLDKAEAIIFIQLLECEKQRHRKEKILAAMKSRHTSTNDPLQQHFWTSCVIRHEEDIIMIDKTIQYLINKFNLLVET